MKELTYILGAGASYESIPVVATFPKRFRTFFDYLMRIQTLGNLSNRLPLTRAENVAKIFNEEIESYQSFDTYFKMMFHTNRFEEIKSYKDILNLYFLWEHFSNDLKGNIREGEFNKKSIIDRRYDALIAALLQPIQNELKTYKKVNFISWNYDLNLFISLKKYFQPNASIGSFKDEIISENNPFLWNVGNQISVINMNGFFILLF